MISLNRRIGWGIAAILTVFMVLLSGCSSSENLASKGKVKENISKEQLKQSSSNGSGSPASPTKGKSISDSDLLNASQQDSTVDLESVDLEVPQLDTTDIDTLLNENNDLKNIPTNLTVK